MHSGHILVTGSAGHLGEAVLYHLCRKGVIARGVDIKASEFTDFTGDIADAEFVDYCMSGITHVIHTATLHKPHVVTHTSQNFIDTNITGTLNLLEAAVRQKVDAFVFTSTTSTFGDAMNAVPGGSSVWVTETLNPQPKNIYGVTKTAAENLCQLFHRNQSLPCIVLRTSRFFPEEDDSAHARNAFSDANLKANELLHRRVDIQDVVDAHLLALNKARQLGFDRFIISATTPFKAGDIHQLGTDAAAVITGIYPQAASLFSSQNWSLPSTIGRIYDNGRARRLLGWKPVFDFAHVLRCLENAKDYRSPLAVTIGKKGYHDTVFEDGPYPV